MYWLTYENADVLLMEAWFNDLNGRFNTAFGYPTEDGRTVTYADPREHPVSDAICIPIEERCLPLLNQSEAAALKTTEQMRADGWFGPPPEVIKKPWWNFLVWWK